MKIETKKKVSSVFAWVAFGILSVLVMSMAQKGFGVPTKSDDRIKKLEARADEAEKRVKELEGAKTELEKARGQVDHWKKAAFEREKAWKDVSEKLEQEAASAKRWREQSFDCLSEYSRATGKKDNSGTLRAIMGTVD